ncbi:O-antigen ligase family protein [Rapidithrix thailandica]|uniref:O-antigen ligase family protein n=1 Tax=Rapidithrix thailandica TaxID=413964 RepID=A0AAW9S7I7_9BACT
MLQSLRQILSVLICALACVLLSGGPFAMDTGILFPTQSGQFFFLLFGGIALAGTMGASLLVDSRKRDGNFTWSDGIGLVLAGYITIHTLILWNTTAPERYWGLLALVVLYPALRLLDKKYLPYILLAIITAGAGQAIYGNLQLYGIFPSYHTGFKMTGSFFNPGPYAGYLVTVFPVAVGVYWFKERLFPKSWQQTLFTYIAILCTITILLVLPASQSRAAWLGALASLGYLAMIKYPWIGKLKNRLPSWRLRMLSLPGLILFIGLAGYGLYTFKEGSANGRVLIWKVTAAMIADQPLWGHGVEQFKARYMDYQAAYFKARPDSTEAMVADNVTYVFNEFLHMAVELGLVGLLLVLGILTFAFFGKTRQGDKQIWVALCRAGLLALLVFSCFSYPLEIWPIVANGLVYLAALATWTTPSINVPNKGLQGIRIAAGLALLCCLPWAGQRVLQQKDAYTTWKHAFQTYQTGAYEACLEDYEKAWPYLQHNGGFLNNYGKALSMAGEHKKAIEVLTQAQNYLSNTITYTALGDSYKALGKHALAEKAYLQAWQMIPSRFYPKYLLAKLYEETNQKQKAREVAKELLEKEVKVESRAINEIKNEMEAILIKFNK